MPKCCTRHNSPLRYKVLVSNPGNPEFYYDSSSVYRIRLCFFCYFECQNKNISNMHDVHKKQQDSQKV